MLTLKNIRVAVKYRYYPGFGTQMKGIVSADICSDKYSNHKKSMGFSGTTELAMNAKVLRDYQDLSSNDDVLKLFKDISISAINGDEFFIRSGMIDTQLSELKLFSSILLSLEFPIGKKYENKYSYSVFDVPELTFETETIYTIFAVEEDDLRQDIYRKIGTTQFQLLFQEDAPSD